MFLEGTLKHLEANQESRRKTKKLQSGLYKQEVVGLIHSFLLRMSKTGVRGRERMKA
jgi:hypothetical protein